MKLDRWFLGASAIGALNTVNAYRPLARKRAGGVLAFALGWPTSEEPLFTIGLQGVAVAAAARRGALRSPIGKAGLALTAVSWAALARLAAQADRVADLFEDRLVAGLGPDYRTEIPADTRAEPPITLAERVLPSLGQRRRYRNIRKLEYGDFGRRNRLDIWSAADLHPGDKAPVILHVHGGGWVVGNEQVQGEVLLSEMARRGWVGVAITYRLSPKATWPDHIIDVKRAIAWTREHIAEYGGDPDFIAITGGSAGGHLCSLAALTPSDPEYQPGFESADTSVQAAVPLYGVYDVGDLAGTGDRQIADVWDRIVAKARPDADPAAVSRASPITRVDADAPPMFVIHGANDTLVPVEQARRFVERLRALSEQLVIYAELPGTQHGFEVYRSVRGLHTSRAIARFLEVVHTRWSQRSHPAPVG
jgi:acetyl esterase/lipase